MKAIETRYRGYRFRSRLEARWAVFFDAMGIQWQYEPQGFELLSGERYLPDFLLSIDPAWELSAGAGSWFEVKGLDPTLRELALLQEIAIESGEVAYLAVGMPGEHALYGAAGNRGIRRCFDDHPFAIDPLIQLGMMCERWTCVANDAAVARAVYSARGARFEHGEAG